MSSCDVPLHGQWHEKGTAFYPMMYFYSRSLRSQPRTGLTFYFLVFYCIQYSLSTDWMDFALKSILFGIYFRSHAICGVPRQDYPATASVCVTPMPRNTADWATILYASRAVRGKYCFPVPWRDGKLVKFVNKSRNLQTFKDIFPSSYYRHCI